MTKGRVVMGLVFFPRGGSAQATRYLAAALGDAGWSISVVTGSLGAPGESTHAPTFFVGLDVHSLDYTAAMQAFEAGASATAAPVPMHASFEDRPDAADVVLAAVDSALAERLSWMWEPPFLAAGAAHADVFHLHHLTPQHDAVARHWPHVPVVAHLHGTEIKLIEAIEERVGVAEALGTTLPAMPEVVRDTSRAAAALSERQRDLLRRTRWDQWRHGDFWRARLRDQAQRADHLVVVSPSDRARAIAVFGVAPERVNEVPNGVDTDRFRPRLLPAAERRARLRRWLVEDPRGWDETGGPGTVSYRESDLDRLLGPASEATVLISVGRFTAAKRVPLLVRAFARARARFDRPTSLVVWGGYPGEWEGEHPVTVADEVGADGIFFVGWRGHSDLPEGLAIGDALVMPSVDDSYPQAPLEAMAVGLPVIATRSGGFPSMINVDPARPTGWLVAPDDLDALADTLVEVVNRPDELGRRGDAALAYAQAELAWSRRVVAFEHAYELARERRASAGSH